MTAITLQFKHHYAEFMLDLNLRLPAKGLTAVLGASGSGKTTLLRLIAGLERSAKGLLCIHETVWQEGDFFVPAHARSVGYVFQESRLFPHLTVLDNIQYAAKRSCDAKTVIQIDDAIALMGIEALLSRKPEKLSGGEKQRVAIARALATQPQILLMDEPFASLDNALKDDMTPYIAHLSAHTNIPIVYVTHALIEATALADYVVELAYGQVKQAGAAHTVLPLLVAQQQYNGVHLNAEETQLIAQFRQRSPLEQQAILANLKHLALL